MAIYTIGDLHLSLGTDKPMDIFGDNWENHDNKLRENWIAKVKENDYVILPGDFSWAMYLEETVEDFKFLNSLPGKKILLKGNHDYWWTTLAKMRKFIKDNGFENIDFIYNNSYLCDNKIIVGTRGWINNNNKSENMKILRRENIRLELSINEGRREFGEDKEIIVFLHYPPFNKENDINEEIDFVKTMKKYNVSKCYYGHLHGESHKDAVEGDFQGIEYKLVSSDYLKFDLYKIV